MKWIFLQLLVLLLLTGCHTREKEMLQKKEAALHQKEQELVLKENALALKEADLLRREQLLDSTHRDSAFFRPGLIGTWQVNMNCTETTCPGSAVGDKKTEQWQLAYQNEAFIANVSVKDELVRTYTGKYDSGTLELSSQQTDPATGQTTNMTVRLQEVDDKHLEGQRVILRGESCKIVYALDMVKQ
jgi:hypothetical protein